jgi:hypothetical protein
LGDANKGHSIGEKSKNDNRSLDLILNLLFIFGANGEEDQTRPEIDA